MFTWRHSIFFIASRAPLPVPSRLWWLESEIANGLLRIGKTFET